MKREELKNLEQDKHNMKLKLQTDAERELDNLRFKLETEKHANSANAVQNRKRELEFQKEENLKEV